jgi:ribonuclease R
MARKFQGTGKASAENGSILSRLPPVFAAEFTGRDRDGDLLAKPVDWPTGDAPTVVVHISRRDKIQPGVGDQALLKIDRIANARDFSAIHALVLKLLAPKPKQVIGVFRAHGSGGRMLPVDKKALGREISIGPNDTMDAQDGELIAVETIRTGSLGLASGRVVERLGDVSSEKAASLIAIHMHGIPHVFPDAVLAEAKAAKAATMKGREDWRALPLITIDPIDAKDHDDAVHAAPDDDPANPGGFILSIAIADVAAYVTPGSAMDAEAFTRGNSCYFPDRVVPMLPERISNDLCSLIADTDRPALAVRVVIGADGAKRSHRFHRIMMRSHAKLAYEQAQAAIDHSTVSSSLILSLSKDAPAGSEMPPQALRQAQGEGLRAAQPNDVDQQLVETVLKPLWAAYGALKKARDTREPLDLDLPERKLILDKGGKVQDVVLRDRLDAHRLIEEMMILANVCAAETLIEKRQALLFRTHGEPSLAKMESLRLFLKTLDIELPKAGALKPALFNRILHRFAEHESAPLVNETVLRSQAQAEYAPENIGHFGLNLRKYAHFTSPIRRYADLIVHRALIKAHGLGDDGLPDVSLDRMRETGERLSAAERRAMMAERDTYDRLIAAHLADQIGAKFMGRVSGVTRAGLFVKLAKTGADGFVPASTLGADFFRHDEAAQALIGDRTGEAFRLGDTVEVRLSEAAPYAGALRFEILSEGRYMKPVSGKRGARRRSFDGPPRPDRTSKRPQGRAARGR